MYVSKIARMTSHMAVVVSYQAVYFNFEVCVLVPMNILGCRKYQTGNQCTKPLLHLSERVSLISCRFVVAYKKPIIEAFFYPPPVAVQGNLRYYLNLS